MMKDTIDAVVAIVGPVVAVFLAFLACQQYRLERLRTKMQLYEKRAEVFRAVVTFISRFIEKKVDRQATDDFYKGTAEAFFLFDKDVEIINFISKVRAESLHYHIMSMLLEPGASADNETIDHARKEKARIFLWMCTQGETARELFAKFLTIKYK